MSVFIYPWNQHSKGAKALNKALGAKIILLKGSKFQGNPDKIVINWGSSELSAEVLKSHVINHPKVVQLVSNKKSFFDIIDQTSEDKRPRVPDHTIKPVEALKWAKEGEVVGRTLLTSSGGSDIIFSSNTTEEQFIKAKLFLKYVKKKEEYRVHIAFGKVLLTQKKVLRKEDEAGVPIDPKTIDFRIRNHSNGFIFQRENIAPDPDVQKQALRAMEASQLDFGAVDVIWNEHEGKAYVLEINTAPGLEGSTIDDYARAFKEHLS